jgi:hypothetical protein
VDAQKRPEVPSGKLATDLEIALHRILSRCHFEGRANIGVSDSEGAHEYYLIVIIDLDAARAISKFFGQPTHLLVNSDPAIWTISAEQAQTIVEAGR